MKIWELAEILDEKSRGIADSHYFNLLSSLASKLPVTEVEKLINKEVESIKRMDLGRQIS